jgi:DnaK suppressor protein
VNVPVPPKTTAPSPRSFEEKLRQQQELIERTLISAVAQGRESVSDDALDVADQAVASYQKELLFTQGTSGHAQLRLIREALRRLEDGEFGECTHCGETIGAKRLEALPWTPYCITCQEKIETGQLEVTHRAA